MFAAAEEGLRHVVRRDVMLYPGYVPFLNHAPAILHYGADYTLAATPVVGAGDVDLRPPEGHRVRESDFYFNKMCDRASRRASRLQLHTVRCRLAPLT